MQCLYCNKKFGFFFLKKRSYCSESHEVAYLAQQSASAMRRLMDPLFSVPGNSPAFLATPDRSPRVDHASKRSLVPGLAVPALCTFVRQGCPIPIPASLAAGAVPVEAEPSSLRFQHPLRSSVLIPFTWDSAPQPHEAIRAEGKATIAACRLPSNRRRARPPRAAISSGAHRQRHR
jgi:hypothetical protein